MREMASVAMARVVGAGLALLLVVALSPATTSKPGVFGGAVFLIDQNGDGFWSGMVANPAHGLDFFDAAFAWGEPGDIAFAEDFNGDGKAEAGVYRNGLWFVDYNGNRIWDGASVDRSATFGAAYTFSGSGSLPIRGFHCPTWPSNLSVPRPGTVIGCFACWNRKSPI